MRHLLLLSLAALASCASGSGPSTATLPQGTRIGGGSAINDAQLNYTASTAGNVAIVALPIASVWTKLSAAYDSIGVKVGTVDPQNHIIGNSALLLRREIGHVALSKYIDCGNAQGFASADTYEIQGSILTQLESDPAGTKITTTIDLAGRPVTLAGDYHHCSSKGVLEPRIVAFATGQRPRS